MTDSDYINSKQQKADREYRKKIQSDEEKRKERNRKSKYRTAKSFINSDATREELEEFQGLIKKNLEK
ncbi:hypothetical protein ACYRFS_12885 [Listeria kieliensis]